MGLKKATFVTKPFLLSAYGYGKLRYMTTDDVNWEWLARCQSAILTWKRKRVNAGKRIKGQTLNKIHMSIVIIIIIKMAIIGWIYCSRKCIPSDFKPFVLFCFFAREDNIRI